MIHETNIQNKEIKKLLRKSRRPGEDCWSDFGSVKSGNSFNMNEHNISLDTSRNIYVTRGSQMLNCSLLEKSIEIVGSTSMVPKPEISIVDVL